MTMTPERWREIIWHSTRGRREAIAAGLWPGAVDPSPELAKWFGPNAYRGTRGSEIEAACLSHGDLDFILDALKRELAPTPLESLDSIACSLRDLRDARQTEADSTDAALRQVERVLSEIDPQAALRVVSGSRTRARRARTATGG